MHPSYVRDTLLTLREDIKISFSIDTYENEIENIFFEVRSMNGERLVEKTEIEEYEEKENRIQCEITLKDLISANEEYMFILFLTPKEKNTIRYYTRIVHSEEINIREKLEYVLDFHNRTFNR